MIPLGKLSHLTKKGELVLRGSERVPEPNSFVVTKDSRRVGKIKDIFGPSSSPYILVQPTPEAASSLSSWKEEPLYELPRKRGKGRR